jgi:hypothetical protein
MVVRELVQVLAMANYLCNFGKLKSVKFPYLPALKGYEEEGSARIPMKVCCGLRSFI